MAIADGNQVTLEYTLRLTDDSIVESNVGGSGFEYTHGSHQVIPGLEKGLLGLEVGAQKRIQVEPEDGYGLVQEAAFHEVEKQMVPEGAWAVGTELTARGPDGREMPVRVHEVRDATIVIDANHPLAGKTLVFDVRVLAVA